MCFVLKHSFCVGVYVRMIQSNWLHFLLLFFRTNIVTVWNNSLKLEKWFPLQGERAHSLKLFCMYDIKNKIEWRRKQNHRLNNLPRVKIFCTLQVQHLILAFIIRNQIIFVYIHKYNTCIIYYELF